MILVDTSIWIDHLRAGNATLTDLLNRSAVLAHPCVTGELALGNLRSRDEVIGLLRDLPQAIVAEHDEVLRLIADETLHGHGIGYVDAQLLAASRLSPDATLWTRDKRLAAVATRLRVRFQPPATP
ncbi:type II toxin-antitoxin system VapC family toxin [Conexibacter sp. CPCC 206217]|uniref:type II toxin-antitoxin system VapC family toxin n=1 Tax=Conexibacter sp. CPCC 206217 TaxID=3064574 RepID=UPI00271FA38B|nr:type II toxin-antitoxin system VapC family toxin [Conexibacter sp. CPCC 206217]MDO8210109.1 type II toxin-antitoxin system VapC family toxin [Conexibacter sp. CPCC 206217]